MKLVVKILLILFILSSFPYAQSENIKKLNDGDSSKIKINSNMLNEIQIKIDEFELHKEFYDMKMKVSLDGDPQTIWLRTSLAVLNTSVSGKVNSTHHLSPFYTKYLKDSEFNPIRYVLGVAQLSAVGYLAYKHIKKYGFLK